MKTVQTLSFRDFNLDKLIKNILSEVFLKDTITSKLKDRFIHDLTT